MPDPADPAAVESQLGRPPRGNWRVAQRCGCGLPQVIETDPRLEDETPFPTLWWLTCRSLVNEVSRLESAGWMARLNANLAADQTMRDELHQSTLRYVQMRDSIEPISSTGHPGGGPLRVKCLHAHTAHHLVTGDNPVGAAVVEELSWRDPAEPCV